MPSEIACRQWHSITAVPINECSVCVVVVGGVPNRAETDAATWPRIKEDFILGFGKFQKSKLHKTCNWHV